MTVTNQAPYFDVGQRIAFCATPDLQGGGFDAQEFSRFSFIAKRIKNGLIVQDIPSHSPDNTQRVSFGSVKIWPIYPPSFKGPEISLFGYFSAGD
ncbi:hypothetical protein Bpro_2966 [Polaromonas sp. JS666]|nr:hypothetical protein Bpro_2966 [Polaromonas sp. JS666]